MSYLYLVSSFLKRKKLPYVNYLMLIFLKKYQLVILRDEGAQECSVLERLAWVNYEVPDQINALAQN